MSKEIQQLEQQQHPKQRGQKTQNEEKKQHQQRATVNHPTPTKQKLQPTPLPPPQSFVESRQQQHQQKISSISSNFAPLLEQQLHQQQQRQNNLRTIHPSTTTTMVTPVGATFASENEDNNPAFVAGDAVMLTGAAPMGPNLPQNNPPPPHQLLQHQSSLSNSNNSTSFSVFSSRVDDEDPIFTLDEDVHEKDVSGERTRHYTADFDPNISDDDEFPKEMESLHGGRAYSASNRFPPRIRHSGRSGPLSTFFHKMHGHFDGFGGGAPTMIPASLPIQISRGFNWPPSELVSSLTMSEEEDGGCGMRSNTKTRVSDAGIAAKNLEKNGAGSEREQQKETVLEGDKSEQQIKLGSQNGSEQEEMEDMYGRIQAYSRSIKPEDDPERIFGERPHRRYSLADKFGHMTDSTLEAAAGEEDSCGENVPPSLRGILNQQQQQRPHLHHQLINPTTTTLTSIARLHHHHNLHYNPAITMAAAMISTATNAANAAAAANTTTMSSITVVPGPSVIVPTSLMSGRT